MITLSQKQTGQDQDGTSRRRTLLIERLDLLTFPLCLWFAWRHKGGYFVDASPIFEKAGYQNILEKLSGLRQLCYENYPGSYFEVQSRSTSGLHDAVIDTSPAQDLQPILNFLGRMGEQPYMEVAFRQVMLGLY